MDNLPLMTVQPPGVVPRITLQPPGVVPIRLLVRVNWRWNGQLASHDIATTWGSSTHDFTATWGGAAGCGVWTVGRHIFLNECESLRL